MKSTLAYALACSTGLYALYKLWDALRRLPRVGRYSDRYILVTGCGSGFGLALVKRLDSLGCHVFAGCRTEDSAAQLAKSCSDRVLPIQMDVSKPDSVRKALEIVSNKLTEDGKELWAVVNNAGVLRVVGPLEWLTVDDYRSTANVNLYGLIDVTMTFLPLIKKSRGRIVIMGSMGGRWSVPRVCPYSVSKYGVEAFTDELRRSMRPYRGLYVSLLQPGYFRTKMASSDEFKAGIDRAWNQAPAEIQQEYGDHFYKALKEKLQKLSDKFTSYRISDVTDAYEDALFGRYPRSRYVLGLDARLVFLPLSWLPECLGDWLIHQFNFNNPIPAVLLKP